MICEARLHLELRCPTKINVTMPAGNFIRFLTSPTAKDTFAANGVD